MIRLNRYLSECGFDSRRKSEELIKQGRVEVNNRVVIDLSTKIDTDNDIVTVDGEKVKQKKKVYFLLNKPKGVITSTSDERNRKTVVDLIPVKEKIFPVGRLDYDTTGVLLLTNDGEFSNFLMHPKNKIIREYEVHIDKPLEKQDKEKLLKGIFLKGKKGRFNSVNFPKHNNMKMVIISTEEGRNHFVKNMFFMLGYKVEALKRISYCGFTVNDLPIGGYKKLSFSEVQSIIKKYE